MFSGNVLQTDYNQILSYLVLLGCAIAGPGYGPSPRAIGTDCSIINDHQHAITAI